MAHRFPLRRLTPALIAGAALLLAGCASSSTSSSSSSTRSPRSGNTFTETLDLAAFREMGFDLRWTGAAVMTRGARVARAAILGDRAVVQETGNAVSLLRTENGEAIGSSVLGNRLTRFTGLARAGSEVYVASDIELFVLDAQTADITDRQPLDLVVNTPPVATDNAVFFGSRTGRVLAHDTRTGQGRWQYQLEGPITAAPVLAGSHIAVASEGGDVIALRTSNGTATSRARAFDGPGGAIDAEEGVIAVASRDQSVYGFSTSGGARLWRYRTESPLTADLAIIEGVAYITIPNVGLVGLDAYTGEEIWKAEGVSGVALGVADGNVIVRSGDTLLAIDDRGETVASTQIRGLHSALMPDPAEGDLYLVTDRGAVSRFNRR